MFAARRATCERAEYLSYSTGEAPGEASFSAHAPISDLLDKLAVSVVRIVCQAKRSQAARPRAARGRTHPAMRSLDNLAAGAAFATSRSPRTRKLVGVAVTAHRHRIGGAPSASPVPSHGSRITGASCMLSCVCAAFATADLMRCSAYGGRISSACKLAELPDRPKAA